MRPSIGKQNGWPKLFRQFSLYATEYTPSHLGQLLGQRTTMRLWAMTSVDFRRLEVISFHSNDTNLNLATVSPYS